MLNIPNIIAYEAIDIAYAAPYIQFRYIKNTFFAKKLSNVNKIL